MRNTLEDLNNHLFAQLERLGDEELIGNKLNEEIGRTKAITSLASQIISTGSLALEATKLMDDKLDNNLKLPKMLEAK